MWIQRPCTVRQWQNLRPLYTVLVLNTLSRYWDEPLDAGAIAASPLFSSPYGFGGNGRASDGCVVDGPFANLTLHLGPAYEITDFCLARAFNETRFATGAQATIDICNTYTDYVTYSFCLQATPHTAGHGGVSGLVG